MFLSVYRFDGEPAALQAAHARLLAMIPPHHVQLNLAVPRPDGLDVYDTCPSRQVFEDFSASADFRGLLQQSGLPAPRPHPLGDVSCATVQGQRVL